MSRLRIDGETVDLRSGEIAQFDGSAETALMGLDNPCHAINLITAASGPVLVLAEPGRSFRSDGLALLGETCSVGRRFDLVELSAGADVEVASFVILPDSGTAAS